MTKLRTTILLTALASTCAFAVVACSAGDSGTLGNTDQDSGPNPTDSGGGDSVVHVDSSTDSVADSGTDTGPITDTGIKDTGKVDSAPDTTPIIPEGGVASAPLAGAVIASNSKYKIIMKTTSGGSNGPMTNSKYDLHGGTVTVTPH
jgi:hypothetical protein